MGDKERILLTLLSFLNYRATLYEPPDPQDRIGRVHIAAYRDPVPGDLVMLSYIHPNPWLVGWFVGSHERGGWWVRELGSDRLCHVSNCQVRPVVGLPADVLLEGKQRRFHEMAAAAFRRIDAYMYRLDTVHFDGEIAIISSRAPFGGLRYHGEHAEMALPFAVTIPRWRGVRSVKALAALLEAGGVGSREYEYVPDEYERARWRAGRIDTMPRTPIPGGA